MEVLELIRDYYGTMKGFDISSIAIRDEENEELYLCLYGADVGFEVSQMENPNQYSYGESLDLVGEEISNVIGFMDTNGDPYGDEEEEDDYEEEDIEEEIVCHNKACTSRKNKIRKKRKPTKKDKDLL